MENKLFKECCHIRKDINIIIKLLILLQTSCHGTHLIINSITFSKDGFFYLKHLTHYTYNMKITSHSLRVVAHWRCAGERLQHSWQKKLLAKKFFWSLFTIMGMYKKLSKIFRRKSENPGQSRGCKVMTTHVS